MPVAASRRILIAGGGIGGLALAIALARRCRASLVLEGRAEFSPAGAGIQLGPNGVRVLESLGVAALLAPHVGVPEAVHVFRGGTGRQLAALPLGAWIAARHGAPYWVAHRADLHGALKAAADTHDLIEIRNGFEVSSVRQTDAMVEATAGNGARETGAALIGADGLWSAVRAAVAPGVTPRFAGASASRVVLARDKAGRLAANTVGLWLSPKAHVVHYPVRGGAEIAAVVIAEETWQSRVWDAEADRVQLAAHLAAFDESLANVLLAADGWRRWSLNRMDELPTWARGRTGLIGDAAHPMFPYLAQGGVLALEDALVLAGLLAETGREAEALASFSEARRARARRVQEASRRNGWIYHLAGPMGLARDAVMAAASGERLMAGLDWLYGWRA
ncbi:MAG: FAD-dependent monooxygenase [Hyphomicrobiaceae bacterium]|nr:FAD-dependent monooxygenase [Hyphomicrobiaceae bacterium]